MLATSLTLPRWLTQGRLPLVNPTPPSPPVSPSRLNVLLLAVEAGGSDIVLTANNALRPAVRPHTQALTWNSQNAPPCPSPRIGLSSGSYGLCADVTYGSTQSFPVYRNSLNDEGEDSIYARLSIGEWLAVVVLQCEMVMAVVASQPMAPPPPPPPPIHPLKSSARTHLHVPTHITGTSAACDATGTAAPT